MTVDDFLISGEMQKFIELDLPGHIAHKLAHLEFFPSRQQIKSLEMHWRVKGMERANSYAAKQKSRAEKAGKTTEANFWEAFRDLGDISRANGYLRRQLESKLSQTGLLGGSQRVNREIKNRCADYVGKYVIRQFCAHCGYLNKTR